MIKYSLVGLILLSLSGCEWVNKNFYDRLLFVEESHIGLKTKVALDHTPGDIDFGYRRSVVALIPKADASGDPNATADTRKTLEAVQNGARVKAEQEALAAHKSDQDTMIYVSTAIQEVTKRFILDLNVAKGGTPDCPADLLDRSEPLSVISSFNADVRWFEATRIHTYFATGIAATRTACDVRAIKALVTVPNE